MHKKMTPDKVRRFQKKVLNYYEKYGRHSLPWRNASRTPYQVLVSEVMLQQTQVDRVIPFFIRWMKEFPNWKKLAHASQTEVLRMWKGLGYNSRALRLQKLAQRVVAEYKGVLPQERSALESLPSIGPYTAGALRVFAFGKPDVFIETNIRRVFIHEFFSTETQVRDADILNCVAETLPDTDLVHWYSALMDYGSHLPKVLKKNTNKQSIQYKKQKKFKGSDREIRGKALDFFLEKRILALPEIEKKLKALGIICDSSRLEKVLQQLIKESFLELKGKKYFLK